MFSLLYQFMPLDEFDMDLYPLREEQLLLQIRQQGKELAPMMPDDINAFRQFGTIRRRTRWHMLPLGGKRIRIWYLYLYHPLWLGGDGKVYREYVDLLGSSYFMEAELHLRDAEGLERVSEALRELARVHLQADAS